ncbi:MAG: hypothetical protein AMXMBFR46_07710 [Acidimicrobiia bacterium]
MLYVHQVHAITSGTAPAFEEVLRERWAPALGREPGMRLAWCARSMPGAISFPEVITLTALTDGAALERYGIRVREGDLREDARRLQDLRLGVATRILTPLAFNPLVVDVDALPVEPDDGPTEMYMHDFVPPRIGMQRAYEDAMQQVYMSMPSNELLQIVIWAGLETVAGGGPVPESLNISHVRDADAVTKLLAFEAPRENKQLGSWMYDALKLRDTWTTRLVRCLSWSPVR